MITTRRGAGLVRRSAEAGAEHRSAAARRARVLVSLMVVVVASWGAVALPGVPWWAAVPATALLVVDLGVLVAAARHRTAARRSAARQVAMGVAASQRRISPSAAAARGQRGPGATAAGASETIDVRAVLPRAGRAGEAFGAGRGSGADGAVGAHGAGRADGDRAGDTWTPVPVPRPTYMLKPVVPRPEPPPLDEPGPDDVPGAAQGGAAGGVPDEVPGSAPGATSSVSQGPQTSDPPPRPWEVDHTWADDLDVVLARRRAVNG